MSQAVDELLVLFHRLSPVEQQSFHARAFPTSAYLTRWLEILTAVRMRNTPSDRNTIRRLTTEFDGPIILGTKGQQPRVVTADLIEWFDGLAVRFQELADQRRGARESVAVQHYYGRQPDTKIVPGISGHTMLRRRRGPT